MSHRDRLERIAAERSLGVNPWHDVRVPNMELFYLASAVEFRGAALVTGSPEPLFGADAFRAAMERGASGAEPLARLSLLLFERGGAPILGPSEADGQPMDVRALIRPPAIDGRVLVYWAFDERGDLAIRSRLDLDTLVLERITGAELARAGEDAIDMARKQLGGPLLTLYDEAAATLAQRCADPRAAAALNEVVASHDKHQARAAAALQLARCHDAGSPRVLLQVLQADASAEVRKLAADALGAIGDTSAKDALLRASRDDADASVRGAAGRAAAKLRQGPTQK